MGQLEHRPHKKQDVSQPYQNVKSCATRVQHGDTRTDTWSSVNSRPEYRSGLLRTSRAMGGGGTKNVWTMLPTIYLGISIERSVGALKGVL